jgi:hypothetical protein
MRSAFGRKADLPCQRVECHQIRQHHFDPR